MYEHRREQLISRAAFFRRLVKHVGASLGIILFSLALGIVGYHALEEMSWIDAFVNAAMLMGGMGPVTALHTDSGKLFAGLYALYCGLIFIIVVGVLAAPVIHRFLHRFHLETK